MINNDKDTKKSIMYHVKLKIGFDTVTIFPLLTVFVIETRLVIVNVRSIL